MADGTVVREELWFDSADGTSRVHGLVWWPAGIIGEPYEDEANPGAASAAQDGASDGATTADPTAVTTGDEGLEGSPSGDVSHAEAAPAGPIDGSSNKDDGAPGDAGPSRSQGPRPTNALEAAALSVRLARSLPTEDDGAADREGDAAGVGGPHPSGARRPGEGPVAHDDAHPRHASRLETSPQDVAPEDDASDAIEVKGIVQLVHGMAEHIGRYDEFARFLADNGYIVCGHDHIGHGGSAAAGRLGCIPARRGRDILVSDVGRLRSIMQERLGDELPYFVFGHSLGSFVVRSYVAREADGLAGAVICGTGHVSPAKSAMAHLFCRLVGIVRGQNAKSLLLHSMGVGPYVRSVRHRRTKNDWLSYREANVDAYNDDELCGFRFSAGGYATVTALTREVCAPAWASRVPRLLPLLLIGGNADAVGDNGEGVRITAQMLRDAGCADVTCMIYRHMRHEILNEDDRQMVFDDVLFWLEVRS